MKPADVKKNLAAYADGELDSHVRQQIEAHLTADPGDRAEVQRWQALRRSASRGLRSTTLPAGLEGRVRARLAKPRVWRRPLIYRIGYTGLAVAAAVTLAFFVWPKGAVATSIRACGLARIYRACAVTRHHDAPFDVRRGMPWESFVAQGKSGSVANVARRASFACQVPDLTAGGGYCLVGACACSPSDAVQVVHAYFRCAGEPYNIVSVFALDRRIQLCSADGTLCPGCKAGEREYHTAVDGEVTLVEWSQGERSYVMCCGLLDRQELIKLARGVKLAWLPDIQRRMLLAQTDATQP